LILNVTAFKVSFAAGLYLNWLMLNGTSWLRKLFNLLQCASLRSGRHGKKFWLFLFNLTKL